MAMCTKIYPVVVFLYVATSCFRLHAQAPGEDVHQQLEMHRRRAHEYLAEKKPELALPELKAMVALDPHDVDALGNLGVLLYFNRDYQAATPPLRAALKLQPGLTKIQALLGMCESRTGDVVNARTDLEAAFSQLQDPKIRLQTGMELIDNYSASSELEKAATIVGTLRQMDPANVQVLYAAYRIYGDLSGESMLSLSLVAPESAQMHQIMAHELARQGKSEGAILQDRKATEIDPKLPGIHFELAELLSNSDDATSKGQAEQEYKTALSVNSHDERSQCRLGDIALLKQDLPAAFSSYSEAVRLQPNDAEANFGLAKTLIAMDQPLNALPVLERAVRLEPTNEAAHFRLGSLYRQQGRVEDAKRELDEYKKYKEMKEKLRAILKEMQIQSTDHRASEQDER
jgi:Flp pilus assembly protein TadD